MRYVVLALLAVLGCAPPSSPPARLAEAPAGLSPAEQESFEVLRTMHPGVTAAELARDARSIVESERRRHAQAVQMADEGLKLLADRAREKEERARAEKQRQADEEKQRADEARARREALPETTRI